MSSSSSSSKDKRLPKGCVLVKNTGFHCRGHGGDAIELVAVRRGRDVQLKEGWTGIICLKCAKKCSQCKEPALDFYEGYNDATTGLCYYCCFG